LMPSLCFFNRTRESFLCLSAVTAGTLPILLSAGSRKTGREDGIWILPCRGRYTVGTLHPVDLVYLDWRHRVVQLIEHLDPLQIVPVSGCCASVLEARTRTIYSSRTRVGDELLICSPEDVETYWKQPQEPLRVQSAWMKQEVMPCSNG
jgi:hypothetical protein